MDGGNASTTGASNSGPAHVDGRISDKSAQLREQLPALGQDWPGQAVHPGPDLVTITPADMGDASYSQMVKDVIATTRARVEVVIWRTDKKSLKPEKVSFIQLSTQPIACSCHWFEQTLRTSFGKDDRVDHVKM
jgi:hypothetical protein